MSSSREGGKKRDPSHENVLRSILNAQNGADRCVTYEAALREIGWGQKRTHWMWYVFPAHRALRAHTRKPQFLLPSLRCHADYIRHHILGRRLKEITSVVLSHVTGRGRRRRTIRGIFGRVDAEKFHECVTTFALACALEIRSNGELRSVCMDMFELFVVVLEKAFAEPEGTRALPSGVLRAVSREGHSFLRGVRTIDELKRVIVCDDKVAVVCKDDSRSNSSRQDAMTRALVRWEWFDGDRWIAYDESATKRLELAHGRHVRYVTLAVDDGRKKYVVDLEKMVQKNQKSGFTRPLRRGEGRTTVNRTRGPPASLTFQPKRRTGPMNSWCRHCHKHRDAHRIGLGGARGLCPSPAKM